MTLTVSAEKVAVGQRQCQGMERLAKGVLRLHGSLYVAEAGAMGLVGGRWELQWAGRSAA